MSASSPLKICVVCADYSGSNGALSSVDDIDRTPAFHCNDPRYIFETLKVHKKDVYFELRKAATKTCSDNHKKRYYDAFFIISDGALDEDRAGIEVLHVLERFGCAFTGARSAFYELTKPEMKVLAKRNGIETAKFSVVDGTDDVRQCCKRLNFPLIVKHISGYSSVGMTKKNKVTNMDELETVTRDFCAEYQSALIEEFVTGLEVTVLACGDSSQPGGCRVYPPVYVTFPEGEDFKHFDLKWITYDGMEWRQLADDHPAMQEILRVTRVAFQSMMNGVGYGRVDLRIDATTNKVVFLELNPNCGIMYPIGQEASADFILELANARESFVTLQIQEALNYRARQMPMFQVKLDGSRELGWTTRATRKILSGTTILSLAGNHNGPSKMVPAPHAPQKQQQHDGTTTKNVLNGEGEHTTAASHQCVGVRLVQSDASNNNNNNNAENEIVTELQVSSNNNNQTAAEAFRISSNTRAASSSPSSTTSTNEEGDMVAVANNNNNNNSPTIIGNIFPSVTMVPITTATSPSSRQSETSSSVSSHPSTIIASAPTMNFNQQQQQQQQQNANITTMKFGLALNDPMLTCSHIIGGGIPFPRAETGAAGGSEEVSNAVFDSDSLCFVATRDIEESEEILV